jgi:hypothetical protein
MTIDSWLRAAIADAEQRGLPELKPLLEGLAVATAAIRAVNLTAGAGDPHSGRADATIDTGNAESASHPPEQPSR